MRFARGDVRDHNVLHLNDHRPSYRPQRTLQQSRRPNIRFREILGASQFSTFFKSIRQERSYLHFAKKAVASLPCRTYVLRGPLNIGANQFSSRASDGDDSIAPRRGQG